MRNTHCSTWIWQETLKILENDIQTLKDLENDLEYGEKH
ncbi:hypothetical protein T09_10360 [Trichinella sp. T9]|nr:hypothetical protein T09_10360 [Trichinella sp. T9]